MKTCVQYLLVVYYAVTICGVNVSVYYRKVPYPATYSGSILSKKRNTVFKLRKLISFCTRCTNLFVTYNCLPPPKMLSSIVGVDVIPSLARSTIIVVNSP
jgi:hypothetical protein